MHKKCARDSTLKAKQGMISLRIGSVMGLYTTSLLGKGQCDSEMEHNGEDS